MMETHDHRIRAGCCKLRRTKRKSTAMTRSWMLVVLASSTSVALAQDCVPLKGSKICPAFEAASISTNKDIVAALYASPPILIVSTKLTHELAVRF